MHPQPQPRTVDGPPVVAVNIEALIAEYSEVPGAATFLSGRAQRVRELAHERVIELVETWMAEHGLFPEDEP